MKFSKYGKELFCKKQKFSIRKFSVGVFSVLIGATFAVTGTSVAADTTSSDSQAPVSSQVTLPASTEATADTQASATTPAKQQEEQVASSSAETVNSEVTTAPVAEEATDQASTSETSQDENANTTATTPATDGEQVASLAAQETATSDTTADEADQSLVEESAKNETSSESSQTPSQADSVLSESASSQADKSDTADATSATGDQADSLDAQETETSDNTAEEQADTSLSTQEGQDRAATSTGTSTGLQKLSDYYFTSDGKGYLKSRLKTVTTADGSVTYDLTGVEPDIVLMDNTNSVFYALRDDTTISSWTRTGRLKELKTYSDLTSTYLRYDIYFNNDQDLKPYQLFYLDKVYNLTITGVSLNGSAMSQRNNKSWYSGSPKSGSNIISIYATVNDSEKEVALEGMRIATHTNWNQDVNAAWPYAQTNWDKGVYQGRQLKLTFDLDILTSDSNSVDRMYRKKKTKEGTAEAHGNVTVKSATNQTVTISSNTVINDFLPGKVNGYRENITGFSATKEGFSFDYWTYSSGISAADALAQSRITTQNNGDTVLYITSKQDSGNTRNFTVLASEKPKLTAQAQKGITIEQGDDLPALSTLLSNYALLNADTITLTWSGVDTNKAGSYTATITATYKGSDDSDTIGSKSLTRTVTLPVTVTAKTIISDLVDKEETATTEASKATTDNTTTKTLSSHFTDGGSSAEQSDKYQRGLTDNWISEGQKNTATNVNKQLDVKAAAENVQVTSSINATTFESTWTVAFNKDGGVKYTDGTVHNDGTSAYGVLVSKDLQVTSLEYSTDGKTWTTITNPNQSQALTDKSVVNYMAYGSGSDAYSSFNSYLQASPLSSAFKLTSSDYAYSYSFDPWNGATTGQSAGKNNSKSFYIRLKTTLNPTVTTNFTGVVGAERYIASDLNNATNGMELSITMATYKAAVDSITYATYLGITSDEIIVDVQTENGADLTSANLSYKLTKAALPSTSGFVGSEAKTYTASAVTEAKSFYAVETGKVTYDTTPVSQTDREQTLKTQLDNLLLPTDSESQTYLTLSDVSVAEGYTVSNTYDATNKKFVITVTRNKTLAESTVIKKPETLLVDNKDALTETEKTTLSDMVKTANPNLPTGTTITVLNDGTVDITFSDKSVAQLTDTVATKQSSNLKAPSEKVSVADKTALTDTEKQAVVQAVAAANPGVVVSVDVDNQGNATVTFQDHSTGTLTSDQTVTELAQSKPVDSLTATNRTQGTLLAIQRKSEVYADGTEFVITLDKNGKQETIKGRWDSKATQGFEITEGNNLVSRAVAGTNNVSLLLNPDVENKTTVTVTVQDPSKKVSDPVSTTVTVYTTQLDQAVAAAESTSTGTDDSTKTEAQKAFDTALATAKSLQEGGSAYDTATQTAINNAAAALQTAQAALEEENSAANAVEKAEAAQKAAEAALAQATADGLISQTEADNLTKLNDAVTSAKEQAQALVDALPSSPVKSDLSDRLDKVTGITIPAVNDSNNDGVLDSAEESARSAVEKAEAAQKAESTLPQTGDDSNSTLAMLGALVTSLGLLALLKRRREEDNE